MTLAPIIAIVRHRIDIDGRGVVTLVAFYGCPLRCRYCGNPNSWKPGAPKRLFSPEQLFQEVGQDQLYYLATQGGVTFGGGEPLLYVDFIKEFRQCCGNEWNITVETSLNVPLERLQKVLPSVDDFIVDIKDLDPQRYLSYTGKPLQQAWDNLKWLINNIDPERLMVRVPHIAGYNDAVGVEATVRKLRDAGVKIIDVFRYTV